MAKSKTQQTPMARLIIDSRDASKDKFITLAEAERLFAEGKADRIDMGPAYPNSYWVKCGQTMEPNCAS